MLDGDGVTRAAKRRLRSLLGRISPAHGHDPDWAIGVLVGPSPGQLQPSLGRDAPILRGRSAVGRREGFVADPFAWRCGSTWFLFYEQMDRWTGRGRIALSTSGDLSQWRHHGAVLAERFHLSYPHVISHAGQTFMVPECAESGAVRLYRADPFPTRWVHERNLLRGPALLDPTPFRTDSGWWMFAATVPAAAEGRLELLSAPDLRGPWRPHPCSPVVEGDPRIARPAGPVVRWDGRLVRFAQDGSEAYGRAVHALAIEELTPTTYSVGPGVQPQPAVA